MLSQAALLENEDIARVTLKPVEYLSVILDDEKNGGRSAALILTREDILSLKRYERHALNIPTSLPRVEQQLGFTKSGIPGLEPKDMLVTYQAINNHGKSWLGIEDGIKRSGFAIDLFAAQFSGQGQQIINYIEKMDFARQLDLTVADLTIEEVREKIRLHWVKPTKGLYHTGSVSEKDRLSDKESSARCRNIGATHRHVQYRAERSTHSWYQRQGKTGTSLWPGPAAQGAGKDIEQLTKEIEQKNKEYKFSMNNIAWGGFGGPIGVAITGGIFGAKAEKIRKEKTEWLIPKPESSNTQGKSSFSGRRAQPANTLRRHEYSHDGRSSERHPSERPLDHAGSVHRQFCQ